MIYLYLFIIIIQWLQGRFKERKENENVTAKTKLENKEKNCYILGVIFLFIFVKVSPWKERKMREALNQLHVQCNGFIMEC